MPHPPRLLILAPGLLGPVADPAAVAGILPSVPDLESLLRRADALADVHHGHFEAACFSTFGLGGRELPVAPVSRFGEVDGGTAHVGEHCWLRADPVHLRVDTHTARLFSDHVLELDAEEACDLVARLNEHFRDDGLRFEAPVPNRWYVAVDETIRLDTHPPHHVAGRNIDEFLPQGEHAGRWRRWLNEAQMLLHDTPVNIERERRGRLPINSFWPWGAGRLPPEPLESVPAAIATDDPLILGLARLGEAPTTPLPESAAEWQPTGGRNLVVTTAMRDPLVNGDIEGWLAAVDRFSRQWLSPVAAMLETQRLEVVELAIDGPSWFRLQRRHRRRLWRRRYPWTHWLVQE